MWDPGLGSVGRAALPLFLYVRRDIQMRTPRMSLALAAHTRWSSAMAIAWTPNTAAAVETAASGPA